MSDESLSGIKNIPVSSEMAFLLEAVKQDISPVSPGTAAVDTVLNYDDLLRLSARHGVVHQVNNLIAGLPAHRLPGEIRERFNVSSRYQIAKSLMLTQGLLDLLELLARHRVPVVPFKGPVLGVRAYGDSWRRYSVDLDVFIQGRDFPGIYGLLKRNGFSPIADLSERECFAWARTGREFVFIKEGLMLDIHLRFSEGPAYFTMTPDLWRDLDTVELDSKRIAVLPVEPTLVALALHGAKHHWRTLRLVVDIAKLVKANPKLEWGRVIALSEKMKCFNAVVVGLCLAEAITGIEIPETVTIRMPSLYHARADFRHFYRKLIKDPDINDRFSKRTSFLKSLDTVGAKFRYFGYYLFTPKINDITSLRLPEALFPLHYLIRPFRLVYLALLRAGKTRPESLTF